MSKPRYDWWPYVKGMIRRYPALCAEYEALHAQSLTASYAGMPSGGGEQRGTERAAIRELPRNSQREYEAVRGAVETTEGYPNGRERLRVVRLVLWERSHNLEGAALAVHVSTRTARRWHTAFIRSVALNLGFLD